MKKLKGLITVKNLIIAALLILLIFELWLFTVDLDLTYRNGYLHFHRPYRYMINPLAIDQIQSWMTFDYLNKVFHLPPDYLQTALKINDPHYPKIQISKYAKSINIDDQQAVNNIKDLIRNYK